MLVDQLLNGLTVGSVYALVAVGYTMAYGVLNLINFAHGSIYMMGGFFALALLARPVPGGAVTVAVVAVLATAALGMPHCRGHREIALDPCGGRG
jgi:branched-chain amino acid transport system permease protein